MNGERYNYARDGFIYLLSYATLLISSVSLNFLLRAITNRFVPDTLGRVDFLVADDAAIIGFMAAVVIAFPIFVYLNFIANRMLKTGRMRSESGVRNWLLYLTLVAVILIIIWQIIQLFMGFLNGTLVAQSLIHSVITLAIAAAVLGYQWWHLRTFGGRGARRLGMGFKTFEWIVFIVVIGSVVGSFFIIDTPAVRRAKRLDEIRVERLGAIQTGIQDYYGWKGGPGHQKLPANLDELISDPTVYIAEDGLVDPTTRERFEYRVTGSTTYELCATFETKFTKEDDTSAVGSMQVEPASTAQRFYHTAGRECFDLTVS